MRLAPQRPNRQQEDATMKTKMIAAAAFAAVLGTLAIGGTASASERERFGDNDRGRIEQRNDRDGEVRSWNERKDRERSYRLERERRMHERLDRVDYFPRGDRRLR
jgi:hypothetical protein